MGTADYMAPEQIARSHDVDIRADLYRLGCTLYKLLAGHAPFATEHYPATTDKAWAHAHASIPPIDTLRHDVPPALAAVLEKLLARRPEDRYATPEEAAAALAPFASGGTSLRALVARACGTLPASDLDMEPTSRLDESANDWISPSKRPRHPTDSRSPSTSEPGMRFTHRKRVWLAASAVLLVALGGWLGFQMFWPGSDAVLIMTFDQETLYERGGELYLRDLSLRHNDGAIHGATWRPDGRHGGAMYFDGVDDYIELTDRGFPERDEPRTISFWFKTAGIWPPRLPHAMVPFWYGYSSPGCACYLVMLPPKIYNRLGIGDPGGGAWEKVGRTKVLDNQWHHAAMDYDGLSARLYLDGKLELDYERQFRTLLIDEVRIGHGFPGEQSYFEGLIDEVRVVRRALSEQELEAQAIVASSRRIRN
jgi:hypothetical protein